MASSRASSFRVSLSSPSFASLKADNYHYLEVRDYLEDKDRMIKVHCSP